jgi:hypothetical protein
MLKNSMNGGTRSPPIEFGSTFTDRSKSFVKGTGVLTSSSYCTIDKENKAPNQRKSSCLKSRISSAKFTTQKKDSTRNSSAASYGRQRKP